MPDSVHSTTAMYFAFIAGFTHLHLLRVWFARGSGLPPVPYACLLHILPALLHLLPPHYCSILPAPATTTLSPLPLHFCSFVSFTAPHLPTTACYSAFLPPPVHRHSAASLPVLPPPLLRTAFRVSAHRNNNRFAHRRDTACHNAQHFACRGFAFFCCTHYAPDLHTVYSAWFF